MYILTSKCPVCGKEFSYDTRRHKIYCSSDCRLKFYDEQKKKSNQEQSKRKKKKKSNMKSIQQIAVEARNAGMSYGEYVAFMEGRCK